MEYQEQDPTSFNTQRLVLRPNDILVVHVDALLSDDQARKINTIFTEKLKQSGYEDVKVWVLSRDIKLSVLGKSNQQTYRCGPCQYIYSSSLMPEEAECPRCGSIQQEPYQPSPEYTDA